MHGYLGFETDFQLYALKMQFGNLSGRPYTFQTLI